jgi:hypothetical protein
MGCGAILCIPSFINTGFVIQKLLGGGRFAYTSTQHGDLMSLLILYQNKDSRLKSNTTEVTLMRLQFALLRLEYDHHKTVYKIAILLRV